jgi:GntR family transcriptional regulator, histidine utilization repressor
MPAAIVGKAPVRREPKFTAIRDYARIQIHSGAWRSGARVPSENELSDQFGVSRMTARRALDQLALDGLIVRRVGSGSFIADNGVRSSFLVIRNIADEIVETGRVYTSRVLRHRLVAAPRLVAESLKLAERSGVFHSLIVHIGDALPVQLEYRYVRQDAAPDYLSVDLAAQTPNHYLQRCCPLTDAQQKISATLPSKFECKALSIRKNEPCLLITRVTASREGLVSCARIVAPASRYQLAGQLHFSSKVSG